MSFVGTRGRDSWCCFLWPASSPGLGTRLSLSHPGPFPSRTGRPTDRPTDLAFDGIELLQRRKVQLAHLCHSLFQSADARRGINLTALLRNRERATLSALIAVAAKTPQRDVRCPHFSGRATDGVAQVDVKVTGGRGERGRSVRRMPSPKPRSSEATCIRSRGILHGGRGIDCRNNFLPDVGGRGPRARESAWGPRQG